MKRIGNKSTVDEYTGIIFLPRLAKRIEILLMQTKVPEPTLYTLLLYTNSSTQELSSILGIFLAQERSIWKHEKTDGKPDKLVFNRALAVDVEIHIRHGTAIIFRGL